jgi:hypothetical protein
MGLAVRRKDDGTHFNAAELAEKCAPDIENKKADLLPQRSTEFISQDELMQAFDAYLSALVRINASTDLSGTVMVPAGAGAESATLELRSLSEIARQISTDPKAAAQLERLVYLGEALGKLPIDPSKAVSFVAQALSVAASAGLVQQKETTQ